jgi:aspartate aminotransferase
MSTFATAVSARPHILKVAPELRTRTLAVNGVSKTYAMTGWRIGWIASPSDLVQAINTFLSQSSGNCCSISQAAAAAAALDGDQSFVEQSVAIYRQRRDAILPLVNAIPGLSCMAPSGAFYLYVNCGGLIGKTTPDGKRLDADGDVVLYFSTAPASRWLPERPMDFRPTSGFRSPPILKH